MCNFPYALSYALPCDFLCITRSRYPLIFWRQHREIHRDIDPQGNCRRKLSCVLPQAIPVPNWIEEI